MCVCTLPKVWSPGHSSAIWRERRGRPLRTSGRSSCLCPRSSKSQASWGTLRNKRVKESCLSPTSISTMSDSLLCQSRFPLGHTFSFILYYLPSLCLGSGACIFLRRFSMPLRSVMPYSKAIFSYSLGWAFFSNSHTSIWGFSSSGLFFLSVKQNTCDCHREYPYSRKHIAWV